MSGVLRLGADVVHLEGGVRKKVWDWAPDITDGGWGWGCQDWAPVLASTGDPTPVSVLRSKNHPYLTLHTHPIIKTPADRQLRGSFSAAGDERS
eukprot:767614-Hanusia_phi.AAC.8